MERTLSPREMEAKVLDRYAALTGAKREQVIEYMRGVGPGRWGPVSQSARDYARRVLDAMGA